MRARAPPGRGGGTTFETQFFSARPRENFRRFPAGRGWETGPAHTRGGTNLDHHLVLRDLAGVLAAATTVALLFRKLKLSVVAAFLVGGAAIGPTGAGLVSETGMVKALAEIGVALLLFTVGLEISFSNLGRMRRRILIGGGGQLLAPIFAVSLFLLPAGFSGPEAVFVGLVLSLSSTAIVIKADSERM